MGFKTYSPHDLVILTGQIKRRTERAILFEFTDEATNTTRTEWFPLSECPEIHAHQGQDAVDTIHISLWIAHKKGIEY